MCLNIYIDYYILYYTIFCTLPCAPPLHLVHTISCIYIVILHYILWYYILCFIYCISTISCHTISCPFLTSFTISRTTTSCICSYSIDTTSCIYYILWLYFARPQDIVFIYARRIVVKTRKPTRFTRFWCFSPFCVWGWYVYIRYPLKTPSWYFFQHLVFL